MFRKNYFTFLLAAFLLLTGSLAAFAQNQPVSGTVVLKKADGTSVPVENALVEAFRTDIKGKLSVKTNNKGEFSFVGMPPGATYVLSISALTAAPGYLPNVKAGDTNVTIPLSEGDGKQFTEEEVRAAVAALANAKPMTAEEQKKAQQDRAKLEAEFAVNKKKVEEQNVNTQKALTEGNDAYKANNYDLAIAKYTEGVNAAPDFIGSAPQLLNNKGIVLKVRAVENYNKAVKSTDAAMKAEMLPKVKQDLEDAVMSYNNSWTLLKTAKPADIKNQVNFDKTKYDALNGLTESYRLLVITKLNPAKAAEAADAYTAYLEIEPNAAKKTQAQVAFGNIMLESGDSEKAIIAYRSALQTSTDNPDALAGLGLSLFNSGVVASNKAQMQEGLNFMTRFAEVAPENHPLKASVKDAVTYLKDQEKLVPQKVTTTKKKN